MNTYSSDEWQRWMHAALDGDAGLYRKLLVAVRPWLLSYFRRRLRGGDCEDLVQMTLLSLHEKRHTYDVTAPFMPWIAAIARNKLIDYVRKTGRHVHVELDEAMGIDDGLQPELAARDVKALLGHLPADQARIIGLHKLNELSVEETAAATGKSPSAVKVIVHRGLKKLQAMVGVNTRFGGGADE